MELSAGWVFAAMAGLVIGVAGTTYSLLKDQQDGVAVMSLVTIFMSSLLLLAVTDARYQPASNSNLTVDVTYCTQAHVDKLYIIQNQEKQKTYFVRSETPLPTGCFVKIASGELMPVAIAK